MPSGTQDAIKTTIAPEYLLPDKAELLGWVQSRSPSTYHGKTLYRDRATSTAASPDLVLCLRLSTTGGSGIPSPSIRFKAVDFTRNLRYGNAGKRLRNLQFLHLSTYEI